MFDVRYSMFDICHSKFLYSHIIPPACFAKGCKTEQPSIGGCRLSNIEYRTSNIVLPFVLFLIKEKQMNELIRFSPLEIITQVWFMDGKKKCYGSEIVSIVLIPIGIRGQPVISETPFPEIIMQ